MREDYRSATLDVADLAPTWHEQLLAWIGEARDAGLPDANAMVLATGDDEHRLTTRTVLAKDVDAHGVTFFTNYTSEKSHQLRQTRQASATFPWIALQRQATVIGTVELLPREDTAEYWRTRPRGSQLGAWASPQSGVLRDRAALEELLASVTERFADDAEIPPPPHWGGWRIVPTHVEFWQGRSDRLHDRLRFRRTDQAWVVERLAP
ncbi:pyridoxamine 5'-phosphate oxidase [Actinomycetospora succinea]|uniref:Pyridoxine/pyridoxamine 5'-phosphate oxidase n=1 Tax=Actinomycetospora succinea TaxID=663603 RepID=A0A4R6VL94_9PSEU|nr:pyridoxamine 5'-phosphate oxidase [Actinomycetospora succinea]TDQ62641.1 pyridoxamine 5'-phosphate oxidase [Actinomycetospora succinea]